MKFKAMLLAPICAVFVTGCAVTGPIDPCAGWRKIEGAPADADAISDVMARSVWAHNEQGRRMGCW